MPTMTCENCGADDDPLFPVRRMYVTPADWDTEGRSETLPDVERWCYSCCTQYPHDAA